MKNGGLSLMAEPRHRSESSFPRKQVQQPIICFCFELSKNLLFECNINMDQFSV